jgi:hypothetical protein
MRGLLWLCLLSLIATGCGKDKPAADDEDKPKKKVSKQAEDDFDDELATWEEEREQRKAMREAAEERGNRGEQAKAVGGGGAEAKKGEAIPGLTEEDAALRGKLNDYSEAIARCAAQIKASNDKYREWVDVEKGPTGEEDIVFGITDLPDGDSCRKLIQKGLTRTPESFELDGAAGKLNEALDKLVPQVKQAANYYGNKAYQQDAFDKAKAIHEPLVHAFDAWFAALVELRPKVETADKALAERELEAVKKKYGKGWRYLWRAQQYRCRIVAGLAGMSDQLDAFKTATGPCRDAIQELTSFGDDVTHGSPVNQADTEKWKAFQAAMTGFESALRGVKSVVDKGELLPEEGEASLATFAGKYRKMQDRARELAGYF